MKSKNFVIGIDGGGTKTIAVLADSSGKIIKRTLFGPSNPNKVGYDQTIEVLKSAIKKVSIGMNKNKIASIYIALAGSLERNTKKRETIKSYLLKALPQFANLHEIIAVEGDQKAAFRSGSDCGDGVVVIAGTGSIAMGWRGDNEAIAGGWDYILGDQGSAFWIGQKVLQMLCHELDGRKKESKLGMAIIKKWRVKKAKDLTEMIYTLDLVEKVASFSHLVDASAKRGDKAAKKILISAGDELALAALTVIKRLNLDKREFPVVLSGGLFRSKWVTKEVEAEIKKVARRVYFVLPRSEPVIGAVKLALEHVNKY